ncbi:NYN domain-containing protein [Cyanobium sp. NIES-981]|uniref:LabA-like NYN domain-containing protein n=1 Tax=Cyanobium sp. NIES-981 TaxID=1851505 RepID=UPI0007DDF1D2|nr:NYN domain-containing protein [Cyanobium sp. NIES-981]SBO42945.1 DUF88 [Cyanobium sp. NIES-981]
MDTSVQPRFQPRPRQLVVAVDGHSMFYAQQKLGWFFDPRRLLQHASAQAGLELAGAFWYAGLKDPSDQRPFRDALTSLGFTVRTRPLRELAPPAAANGGGAHAGEAEHRLPEHRQLEHRQLEHRAPEPRPVEQRHFVRANLDVEVAVDLMMVAPRTDEVWLLSGSRDLDRLVEVLRAKGLRITLISTEGMVARELRNAADGFVDLASLRGVLEKAESIQQPVFLRT